MLKGIVEWGLNSRVSVYFITVLIFIGGIASLFFLGKLEDPNFSIKVATVITEYPGATPLEVEKEVTEVLEAELQRMGEVKELYSISRAGVSIIKVTIKDSYWSKVLPQVWDNLRKRMSDVARKLPPGVSAPLVNDDFGYVYGFMFALTGDGFTMRELEKYAEDIRRDLSLVKNVARVDFWGIQEKVIYLNISEEKIKGLNLTLNTINSTLQKQNTVVNAGSMDVEHSRFRMNPTGEFTSPEEIKEVIIVPKTQDILSNLVKERREEGNTLEESVLTLQDAGSRIVHVRNIADLERGYADPPLTMMYYNGKPAIGIIAAGTDDSNIVDVGKALDLEMEKIASKLPVGIKMEKISWQSTYVEESVNSFVISLIESFVIVLIVLIVPSGFRMGMIIGVDLILVVLATFAFMFIIGEPLHRMSLGALIIAMGMMVDNSIVIADGMAVKMRQGKDRITAAIESAAGPAMALLAATLIAALAFFPIFVSKANAGEYLRSLFTIVGSSLLISWLISIVITPLQCVDFLPEPEGKDNKDANEEFNTPFYKRFKSILNQCINKKYFVLALFAGLLVLSVFSFGFVRQLFFPQAARNQIMVDLWEASGTNIYKTKADALKLTDEILKNDSVTGVTAFIGAGSPRFYLPVDSEQPYSNYVQLIVNFKDYTMVDPFIAWLSPKLPEIVPDAAGRFRKYGLGPSNPWPFELRVLGPADADLNALRKQAEEIKNIAAASPYATDFRLDTQNKVLKIDAAYDQKKGRWSSIDREDLAESLKRSHDGVQVGLYREGKDLYPIIMRSPPNERKSLISKLNLVQVKPRDSVTSTPLTQVVTDVAFNWEDPLIIHYNRKRETAIQGAATFNATFPELKESVDKQIFDHPLQKGFELKWGGEEDSSKTAQKELVPGVIPAIMLIILILVLVFNDLRPVTLILLVIPFSIIGVTFGLLFFDVPFGFVALLGAMSLAGMMNKNIVILIDACTENLQKGMNHREAIIEATIQRARPVMLAAGTTFLGVIPLLGDVFWVGLAVSIMGGLAIGSLLTLILTPVIYAILYKIGSNKEAGVEK